MTRRAFPITPRTLIAAGVIALAILAQGITAPFVKDAEPQAASWIQDVASGRHLLVPRDFYGELARKPPLFYWASGAIAAATGGHVDEVRARVTSVAAAAVVAVAVLIWTAAFIDSTTGWLAFLFLLGSYAFTSRATLALEDMPLLAFVFGGWCLIYPILEDNASRGRITAIGMLLGLGVLTKGPVALVLPALGVAIYLFITRRSIIEQLRRPWPWMVLALAVAVALPWYIAALWREGGALARVIFQENAGHLLPAGAGGTGEAARPVYYIAMKMIGGITPLNFLVPALIVALWRYDITAAAWKPLRFQLSFLIAVLLLFSAASAKRDDYVLAGIPPLAILLAALFTLLESSPAVEMMRDGASLAAAVLALLSVAALMGISTGRGSVLAGTSFFDRGQGQMLFRIYFAVLSRMFVVIALPIVVCACLIIAGVLRKHPLRIALGMGSLSLIGVLIVTAVLRPELSRQRTLKYPAADINQIAPNEPIYVITENQELSFYLGRQAPLIVAHNTIRSIDRPAFLFAYQPEFRGVAASLRDRLVLIRQWDRLGSAGPPALYRIEPEGLKAPPARDK